MNETHLVQSIDCFKRHVSGTLGNYSDGYIPRLDGREVVEKLGSLREGISDEENQRKVN